VSIIFKIFKYILISIAISSTAIYIFLQTYYQFGGSPDKQSQQIISNSNHYTEEGFVNIYNIPKFKIDKNLQFQKDSSMQDWFFPPKEKNPSKPIPSIKLNFDKFTNSTFTWLGHSTILMNIDDTFILTDPVFNRASPIPVIGKPFPYENNFKIEDLPTVDVVIISHDHYDHLDAKVIKKFKNNVEKFIVPLGVKGHLVEWGIDKNKVTELDWFESKNYRNIKFTLTPAQHFSGRSFTDHNKTLWGSWVIKSNSENIYFSGDSGYSNIFTEIGEKYGPFDLAFIECGGYNSNWADVHMFPYEVVQSSIDLNANSFIPISWAKFDLSLHSWKEPIIRVTNEAKKNNVKIGTPMIGEVFKLNQIPTTNWWMTN